MMLSKVYNEKKVKFPCLVSQKLDGMPVIFWMEDGLLKMSTRKGKPILSIDHIYEQVAKFVGDQGIYLDNEVVMVGELLIPGEVFSYSSGKVRKGLPCPEIQFYMFHLNEWYPDVYDVDKYDHLHVIENIVCYTQEYLDECIEGYDKDWEGLIIRHGDYVSAEGDNEMVRSWNSMKHVRNLSVDLQVVGFYESVSEYGVPKGMIGGFYCMFNGEEVRISAGKMCHKERKEVFDTPLCHYGRIIQVQYKKDNSYKKLREATFQMWRDDKTIDDVNEET